jgi:hypothetical protein
MNDFAFAVKEFGFYVHGQVDGNVRQSNSAAIIMRTGSSN